MSLQLIRTCAENVKFSSHAQKEMLYEENGPIYEKEIKEAILTGEIIEEYPGDKPYPSYLISGQTCLPAGRLPKDGPYIPSVRR